MRSNKKCLSHLKDDVNYLFWKKEFEKSSQNIINIIKDFEKKINQLKTQTK